METKRFYIIYVVYVVRGSHINDVFYKTQGEKKTLELTPIE